MTNRSSNTISSASTLLILSAVIAGGTSRADAQGFVPGTGQRVAGVGDDFEDADWKFNLNLPKSSANIDQQDRQPGGEATNGRWMESMFRGTPDIVERVATPEGGLPGSKGSLLLKTRLTGIPGHLTHKMQQDDLLLNISTLMGTIPVSSGPSCVVRVYLPPFDQWEKRTGASFGVRADCEATVTKSASVGRKLFSRTAQKKIESYWPGIFIQFNSKTDGQRDQDSALIVIRGDVNGQEIVGPMITQPGWWTLGMSFTHDGMVHYYASPGVDNLTPRDHLASVYPYGFRCERFNTFFFNIVNNDDGRSWSTPWVIDDPALYLLRR